MDKQIYLTARMIANESATATGPAFDATVSKLRSLFGDISAELGNGISTIKGLFETNTVLFDKRAISNSIDGFNFMSVSDLEVAVPMGLNVPMQEYLEKLQTASTYANTVVVDVLKPSVTQLAKYVAKPELMMSVRPGDIVAIRPKLQETKEMLGECLNHKAQLSKVPFKKAYRRLGEYESASVTLNDLNKSIRSVDLSEITELTDRIVDLFDKLHANLTEGGKVAISGPTADTLAKIAVALAEEIEFFGVYYHKLQEATESYKLAVKRIETLPR